MGPVPNETRQQVDKRNKNCKVKKYAEVFFWKQIVLNNENH